MGSICNMTIRILAGWTAWYLIGMLIVRRKQ